MARRRLIGGRAPLAIAVLAILATDLPRASAEPSETQKRQELERVQNDLVDTKQKQKSLEEQAAALSREVDDLRSQLVDAGQSAKDKETSLTSLESQLAGLERDAKSRRADLTARQSQISALLVALERLSLYPPEAMLVAPHQPEETVRGGILMAATLPGLDDQAQALRRQLTGLADLEKKIRQQRDQIKNSAGTLTAQRRQIEALLRRKAQLEAQTRDESQRLAERGVKLAASAADLHDLIDKLQAEREATDKRRREEEARIAAERAVALGPSAIRPPPPGTPAVGEAVIGKGLHTYPAAGKILSTFGQETEYGAPARGITIETRPDATVVAPAAGHVLFAGPFRGYGQILIIEHGDGYHGLIAGLGRIDAEVGAAVAAGEPVGIVGPSSGRSPTLYFELRRAGQPLNPQPWLTAQRAK